MRRVLHNDRSIQQLLEERIESSSAATTSGRDDVENGGSCQVHFVWLHELGTSQPDNEAVQVPAVQTYAGTYTLAYSLVFLAWWLDV